MSDRYDREAVVQAHIANRMSARSAWLRLADDEYDAIAAAVLASATVEPSVEHPALVLLADTLRATSGPARPEDIAKLLGHALTATGYALVRLGGDDG